MAIIASTHNQHVALCRALHRSKTRREAGKFLVEGVRLAREALDCGVAIELALYDRAALERTEDGREVLERLRDTDVTDWAALEVTSQALAAAAETRTPQGVVLVGRQPEPVPATAVEGQNLLLVVDRIADAGNAGTILRSAVGAGLRTVVFAGDTVDPWIGKVVRAGMGAHFRLDIVEARWKDLAPMVSGYQQIIAAEADAARSMYELDWSIPTALIVGSEAHGVSDEARSLRPAGVRIPMAGGVESLNAAVAASIMLFHAAGPGGARTAGDGLPSNPG